MKIRLFGGIFLILVQCAHSMGKSQIFSRMRGGTSNTPDLWGTHKPMKSVPDTLMSAQQSNSELRKRMEKVCRDAQSSICKAIEELDGSGKKFKADAWSREGGGGGISKVLADGKVFEKAGVNLSVVYGKMPAEALRAANERGVDRADRADGFSETTEGSGRDEKEVPFFAVGISSVLHPRNPHCPTMHFNYRYFETAGGSWWFGGGTDLTPSYLDEEDVQHFHGVYKDICDKHDPQFYDKFKKWADEYFVIAHRGETRGVGGIFYDDLNDRDPQLLVDFAEDALAGVIPAYAPIIAKHMDDPFTDREKNWQLIRRGR
ncbi:CPX [Symbiodinium microadriaticum]|nr:CPX [Symbiodinium microadriaticum]